MFRLFLGVWGFLVVMLCLVSSGLCLVVLLKCFLIAGDIVVCVFVSWVWVVNSVASFFGFLIVLMLV